MLKEREEISQNLAATFLKFWSFFAGVYRVHLWKQQYLFEFCVLFCSSSTTLQRRRLKPQQPSECWLNEQHAPFSTPLAGQVDIIRCLDAVQHPPTLWQGSLRRKML